MQFASLSNYKHARSAVSIMVALDQMFVLNMMSSSRMASDLFTLLSYCQSDDDLDPLAIEKNFLNKFHKINGQLAFVLKLISAFVSLDNKLKMNANKEVSINETAMFLQATVAEDMKARKNGKIQIDLMIVQTIFEEIDNFIYAIEN